MTSTVGPPEERHVDVSLWYRFASSADWTPTVDAREAAGARWWTRDEVEAAGPARFDPHLGRCLTKLSGLLP